MKAVYTFEADNDDELSFEMDDIIEVFTFTFLYFVEVAHTDLFY